MHPHTHDNGNAASEPCSSVVGWAEMGQPPVVFARSASDFLDLRVATSRSLRPELTSESDHAVRVTKSASLSDCYCQCTARPRCGCGFAGACVLKGWPKGPIPFGPYLIS